MSVILNKAERMNPLTRTKKWYVTLKSVSQVSESEVAKQIAEAMHLSPKEA